MLIHPFLNPAAIYFQFLMSTSLVCYPSLLTRCITQVIHHLDYSSHRNLFHIPGSLYMNATLLRHGCLSPSPTEVSISFSLRSLELYRRLRLRQPRLSIQAWLKAICDTHNVCLPHTSITLTDTRIRLLIDKPYGVTSVMHSTPTS